jgi:hypothetical protein
VLVLLALLAAPQVDLGPTSGVSPDDVQVALQEVRSAIERSGAELHVQLQVLGGVTRVLLVLELIADGEVDARAECSAAPHEMAEARSCLRAVIGRFKARARPVEVPPPEPTPSVIAEPMSSLRIAAYTLVGVSGALAIAGAGLASHASVLHDRIESQAFVDDRFRELERDERSFAIAAGSVLGTAVVTMLASVLLAVLE